MREAVQVSAAGAARLRRGHPWVYASDVVRAPATAADVVTVHDERGRALGTALFAPGSPLPLRFLDAGEVELDEELLRTRLAAALAHRRRTLPEADAYRWVHAEADLLPGLVVDRYGEVAVVQTASRAMDAREPLLARLLVELGGVRLVVARDDGSARDFEGLPRRKGVLLGSGPTRVTYTDAGSRITVDVLEDGKTGGFLDQVENHARAGRWTAPGEALDCFTYHGGFALALARAGARVLALDESSAAVARARDNAAANGLADRLTAQQEDAFTALRRMEGEGRRFDTVVVDPPALAKRRGAAAAGPRHAMDRVYEELTLRALRLARPGGLVVTCSCSGKMTFARFGEVVDEAAGKSGRRVQLLARAGAGPDHPVLAGVPETEYLKAFFLRVVQ